MTRRSPYVIVLSSADRVVLEERARAYTASFATVVRSKIVLLAADGEQNTRIAERLDVHVDVVSRWRKRFYESGLAGLVDRAGRGRPRSFAPNVVSQVKAMACEPPVERDVPLSRWSSAELAAQAVTEGLVGVGVGLDGTALAARGRDQALAAPVVDLPAGPRFRGQGRPGA